MKKIITLCSGILLLLALSIPAQAVTGELAVTAVTGSNNTAATAPAQYLVDNDESTVWQSGEATTGPLWAELQLGQAAFIAGLQIYGPYTGKLNVEYWQDGGWRRFLAVRDLTSSISGWNLIDLSYDRIVCERIRITLTAPQPVVLGGIGAVKALGWTSPRPLERLEPVAVSTGRRTETAHPAENLFDHNTYTSWQVRAGIPDSAETVADFGETCAIRRIKLFGGFNDDKEKPKDGGMFRVQYLSNNIWLDIPGMSNLTVAQLGNTWQSINLGSPITAQKVRMVFYGFHKVGGLKEIEFWGQKETVSGSKYLDANRPPVTLSGANSANYCFNIAAPVSGLANLHLVGSGSPDTVLTWELNGRPMGELQAISNKNGRLFYMAPISPGEFWDGANFIRISGSGFTIDGCRIELAEDNGRLVPPDISPLADRWLLTPVFGGQIIDLGGLYHIDELIFTYTGNQPNLQLAADLNGEWANIDSTPRNEFGGIGGTLTFTGIGLARRIKVLINLPDSPAELIIHGSRINDGPPRVHITAPMDGECLNLMEWAQQKLTGTVDNPEVRLTVNGKAFDLDGASFSVPLPQLGLKPNETKELVVTATDSSGRAGTDQITISIGLPPGFSLNLPDQIIYTKDSRITVSGQVLIPSSKVWVNGAPVGVTNRNFSTVVQLQEGLNEIIVKVAPLENLQISNIKQRWVVRNSSGPYLKVSCPLDGQITNSSTIQVSGEISSLSPVQVAVNGQPAVVNGGYFISAPLPLTEGDNSLSVTATDATGAAAKVTLAVKRDSAPPLLADIIPIDGAYLNTGAFTVSGKASDDSPVTVLVNGKAATVANSGFSVSLSLNEGQNNLKIIACDAAGNQTSLSRGVYIDLTPPVEFKPAATPSGWTNNNRPVITFDTGDGESGIDHFEIKLDDGPWNGPATSPYQFATAIPDGEHTVSVKAVDKAGNERIGEAKLYIDTTPPGKPKYFRPVPGNGLIILKWEAPDPDVIEYRISRSPAWPAPYQSVTELELADSGLVNGDTYQYTIWAIDRAGNIGPTSEPCAGMAGLAEAEYQVDKGSVVEYQNMTLFVHPGSLPEAVETLTITEIQSPDLEDKSIYPIVSPIYNFSATVRLEDNSRAAAEHLPFEKEFQGMLAYDPARLPEGFPEQNLGVYYFDPMWGRWFKVEKSGVDIVNHQILFSTNHFTSFSVQPTVIEDLSPQQVRDVGYSPFKTQSVHENVTISPEGGSAMATMTELVLPGRNGFDFVLKRSYDTSTALGDAQGTSFNAAIHMNIFSIADPETRELVWRMLEQRDPLQITPDLEEMVKKYFQNNGDFSYSMGLGWRLNLPYIRGTNSSVLVRLPSGSFYSIYQMQILENDNPYGVSRRLLLENHEGEDFTLYVEQQRLDIDYTDLIKGKVRIPGWQVKSATLILSDGTTYEMDALGRTTRITDPSGLNEITIAYNGFTLDYIQDSMGRKILFGYAQDFMIPRINKIWIEDENNPSTRREINYVQESGIYAGIPAMPLLKKAVDVGGREFIYEYRPEVLFSGGVSLKVNLLNLFLDIITGGVWGAVTNASDITISGQFQVIFGFPLTSVRGPGIGTTKVYYECKTLRYDTVSMTDYFLGFIPVSLNMSFEMMQRLYASKVEIYKTGQVYPVQTVNYTYDVVYYDFQQFYTRRSVVDNGRTRTTYYYSPIVKQRNRWIDWSDALAEQINKALEAKSIVAGCFSENPITKDVMSYNTDIVTCDSQTGLTLESNTTSEYDMVRLRPLTQTTWRGVNSRRITYRYDGWGNVIYQEDYSTGERINQTKTWTYYWPNQPGSGAPWLSPPYQQASLTRPRRDLPVGKIVANYTPVYNGQPTVTYLHTYYQYSPLGQPTGIAQWNGNEWLYTRMEYDAAGNMVKKTNPEGHQTVYEYDSHGLPSAVIEKAVQDAMGKTMDLTTRFGYEYITGWKLWQQDPRGYVTQYQYDALGRTTRIIAPDDDDPAGWIPSGSVPDFRSNNPVTAIDYDDVDLYSIVTDPLGNRTKYDFDSLGRLAQVVKYHRENGQDKPVITTLEYNGWGDIIAITDPNLHTTRYQYDCMGRNTAIEYPDEQGRKPTKRMEFNYSSNVLTITDENGKQTIEYQDMQGRTYKREQKYDFEWIVTETYFDGLGNEVITIDPKGSVTVKTYNILNQLARVDLPAEEFYENGTKTTVSPYQRFIYNKAGFKIAEIRPLAGTNEEIANRFEVDALGRTIRTITPYRVDNVWTEAVSEIYYDGNGNKVKVIDANNTPLPREQQKAAIYEYSAANLLTAEIDPAGNKTTYTYDKAGNRTGMTDPRGNSGKYDGDFTIIYEYDDLNRLVRGYLPAAPGQTSKPVISLTYDARGNLVKRVEPDGGQTSYTYTARNKVKTETVSGNGISYTTEHHYDLAGNETEIIDPKGNKILKEYDDLNRVKTITYPEEDGKVVERFRYDENGNQIEYINGRLVATNYEYDRYNRLVAIKDGNNGVTLYRYDRWGNMTQMVNALEHTTNYVYDELNRLLKETDPQGHVTQYGYDPVGNRLWSIDPNGTRSDYLYTPNNLVSQVTVQNGDTRKIINYLYDEAGFRKWVKYDDIITEYNIENNQYIPDPFGRIRKETKTFDGKSFTVGYEYDPMGRVTKVIYPTGREVEYQYNSLGQLQKAPGYVDEAPAYDQGGLLKSLKAANGVTTSFDYDKNGRLVGLNYANQAGSLKAYALEYDEANNIINRNNDNFQYDRLNQLLYANLKGNFEVDQEEEAQKVDKVRDDFKGLKAFEFELGQLDVIELDYAAGSIGVDLLAPVKVTRIELQPDSPVHRVTKPTSVRVYLSQDNITYTRFKDWKMVAGEKGRVEIVFDTPATARYVKVKSMFDERDSQLNPVNVAQFKNTPQDLIHVYYLMNMRQEEYSYDKIGNRLTETVTQRNPVSRTYTYYPNSSRLKTNGKYVFEYDPNGNLIKKETLIGEKVIWKYDYDLFNRLVKVTKNDSVISEYMYDEGGLRIKKTSPKEQVYYVFDTGGNVLYEQENREYMEYIYVLGKHFARVDGNLDGGTTKKYFYHTDHLGSTVLVTDETGKQVWNAEFTPFGKQVSKEGEMDHVTQFTGKDLDEDTGLYYFNARWMDPETGRFITEDSVDDPNNPNLYVYVANNPINSVDPTGHWNEDSVWWNPFTWFNSSDGNNTNNTNNGGGSSTPTPTPNPTAPTVTVPTIDNTTAEKVKNVYDEFKNQNPDVTNITPEKVAEFARTQGLSDKERLYLSLMIAHDNPNFLAGYKGDPTVSWLQGYDDKHPTWCNAYAAYALYLFSGDKDLMNSGADASKMGNFRDPTTGWTLRVTDQINAVKDPSSGWTKVTAEEAQNYANNGKFVVGVEPTHIAVVAPGEGQWRNGVFYPAVGQEGGFSKKYNEYNNLLQGVTDRGTMNHSWTASDFKKVEFYVKLN